MMRIKSFVFELLTREVERHAPRECCGILWGRSVFDYTPYPGPLFQDRFELDDHWLLRQFLRGREEEVRTWGFYHSHPRMGADLLPSRADCQGYPPGGRCLILGQEGAARAFQFHFGKNGFQELEIRIE